MRRADRQGAAILVGALVLAACGGPTPTATASGANGELSREVLVVQHDPQTFGEYGGLQITEYPTLRQRLVYSSLYRLDERLTPQPDLAAALCEADAAGTTIACDVRDATFHDGTPVTAQDVAFSFVLASRETCTLGSACQGDWFASAETGTDDAVAFGLTRPYAPFTTVGLAMVPILPEARIRNQFTELQAAIRGADLTAIERQLLRLRGDLATETPPDCGPEALTAARAVVEGVGVEPPPAEEFIDPVSLGPAPEPRCQYLARMLDALLRAAEPESPEAIAGALPALPIAWQPLGSGPYRFDSWIPGSEVAFTAVADYHHGAPAIERIRIVALDDAAATEAFRRGEVDVLGPNAHLAGDLGNMDVRFVNSLDLEWIGLLLNVRDGQLFADPSLREAVALCIDKERTVESVTGGMGTPIYSPILPDHWAYQPSLGAERRDVERARELIETAGWTLGPEGIYQNAGRRLAFDAVVRAEHDDRIRFLELVAHQLDECGIELTTRPVPFLDYLAVLGFLPDPPDTEFDALVLGWAALVDPDVTGLFHSGRVPSDERRCEPHCNFAGFADPEVDQLLEAGLETYEVGARGRIYRELQERLARVRPVIYGWAIGRQQAFRAELAYADGPLPDRTLLWFARIEDLVLKRGERD